ncbi:MAG: NADAR domain-containing protein [Olsenella sp.]
MEAPVFSQVGEVRLVVFGAPDGQNGCLSVWHRSPVDLHGRRFASVGQYLVHAKALTFGDEATAMRVFAMDNPAYLRNLSRQVTPFDAGRWAHARAGLAREALAAKFEQDEELAAFLRATGDATIAACLGEDDLWGTGVTADAPEAAMPLAWRGGNLLGRLLEEVRAELPEPPAAEAAAPVGDAADAPRSLRELKLAAIDGPGSGVQGFLRALRGAMVVVPVQVVDAPEDYREAISALGVGETLPLREGTQIEPCVLADADGTRWLAAFSDASELDAGSLAGFSFVNLPMVTAAGMALNGGGQVAGVVLDPFTQAMQIPEGVLRDLDSGRL